MMLFPLCIRCTAVLAKPTVTQVKEVSGLMHILKVSFVLCTVRYALACRDVTNHTRSIQRSFRLVTSRQAKAYRTVQSTKALPIGKALTVACQVNPSVLLAHSFVCRPAIFELELFRLSDAYRGHGTNHLSY